LDLYPVIASLVTWGDRWMSDTAGVPIELVHRACGHVITPQLICPECQQPLSAREMQARLGPALQSRVSIPIAADGAAIAAAQLAITPPKAGRKRRTPRPKEARR
jgi:hypothetical protein